MPSASSDSEWRWRATVTVFLSTIRRTTRTRLTAMAVRELPFSTRASNDRRNRVERPLIVHAFLHFFVLILGLYEVDAAPFQMTF